MPKTQPEHTTRPQPATERPMRADARRNREKIMAIAAETFATAGVDASLEAMAREAGIGIGTLYRHFPTREALIEAVYCREVEGLAAAAEELRRTRTPDEALAEWMQRFVHYIATKRGMRDSLKLLLESNSPLFAATSGKVPLALRGLIGDAVAAGAIRRDADADDVLHALSSLYSTKDGPDWRERSQRLVNLLMDGLRYGAPNSGGRGGVDPH